MGAVGWQLQCCVLSVPVPLQATPTYNAIIQMEYLDMVVNESIRLYPAGGWLERVCKRTVELNGVTIPEGMVVLFPAFVLHRDPQYWPEPDEFRPESKSHWVTGTMPCKSAVEGQRWVGNKTQFLTQVMKQSLLRSSANLGYH
uniref:Uncharacterized protein n=1 Tax=Ficedula albicollis TaxID=59894 RepID=A0A803VL56_FICAL